jgi:hypothetical protein
MQLFGLHYWGIMDPLDLEWYTAILNECKSLNINDFLHNVSPYVVTRPLPPQRAEPTKISNLSHPTAVPRHRIVESKIFQSVETRWVRSDSREDTPYLGTLVGEGSREFNQFGTMQGEVTRSELFTDPDIFTAEGGNLVSSSQGYQL